MMSATSRSGSGSYKTSALGLDAGFGEQLGKAGVLTVALGFAAGDRAHRQAGVGPLGIEAQQVGEQQHQVAVVLQPAPPQVDSLLLTGFVGPSDTADDGALAGVGQCAHEPQLGREPLTLFGPSEHDGVGLQLADAAGLGDAEHTDLEVRHHMGLAERGQAGFAHLGLHLGAAPGRSR